MQLSPSTAPANFNLAGLSLPGFPALVASAAPVAANAGPADFAQMFPGLAATPAVADQPRGEPPAAPKPPGATDPTGAIFAFWPPLLPVTPESVPVADDASAITDEPSQDGNETPGPVGEEPTTRPQNRAVPPGLRKERGRVAWDETAPQENFCAQQHETPPTPVSSPSSVVSELPVSENLAAQIAGFAAPAERIPQPIVDGPPLNISTQMPPPIAAPVRSRGANAPQRFTAPPLVGETPLVTKPTSGNPISAAGSSAENQFCADVPSRPAPTSPTEPVAMPLFPASQPELDDVFALPMEPVFSDGENPTTVVSPGLQADASVEVPDYVAQFVPRTGALSRFTAEPARSPASPLGFAAEPASSFSFRAEVETRPAPVPLISQTTLPGPIAASFSPPIPPAAKTAEARDEISADLETPSITVEKEFLGVPAKRVTTASATLGTGIAKLENAMPAAQLSTRHSSSAPENAFVSAATASVSQESVREIGLGAPTATPGTAQQAVEAVLVAVDRAGAGDRHVVNLKFSVGGENLDVRVEVRADAVQATFRTDSADLRNALSHEWQAANPAQTERSGRIAPPVFASSDTPSFSSSSGEGSPRHREQAATRVEDPLAFSLRQNRAPRAVANNSSLEPRTVLSAAGSALRLHAHA